MDNGLLTGIVFLAGVTAGSFLNVVIHRGPVMWRLVDAPARGDLVGPRSYCPACRSPLRFVNLVPLVSFLAQRGKCAACGAGISVRYPLVEILGGASALSSVLAFGWTPAALLASVAAMLFIALAFIDLETGYLPDALTFPLAALGLAANAFGLFASIGDALLGAVLGFLVFWAIGAVYRRARNREGLGLGDAKLLAAIGAWIGWIYLPFVIFIAATATLLAAITRPAGMADDAIPFGPGLCAAGAIALFFSERLFSAL